MATHRYSGSIKLSKMTTYGLDQNDLAKHPGSEDDDSEAFDEQELNAPTLFNLVTNHTIALCSPVRRVRE